MGSCKKFVNIQSVIQPLTHPTRGRVALLEDNPVTCAMLDMSLSMVGYTVVTFTLVGSLTDALHRGDEFDVLLLDWALPDGTAANVIATVRNELRAPTPILVASIVDDEATIVTALEQGADDYVVKPLRLAEVIARLGALLRRSDASTVETLKRGNFAIDWTQQQLMLNGQPIGLTAKEFALAAHLFRHTGKLLTREHLLSAVWGVNSELETRTVDAHVARLRSKIPFGPGTGAQLLTEHGLGYRLVMLADA